MMVMSKYTTEVRFLCEYFAEPRSSEYENLRGVRKIDKIIDIAREDIFDFDFPIFDENYRAVLEDKILKHYYTREIGCETFGEFQLMLSAKLNDIMPKYNKLYASELYEKLIKPLSNMGYVNTDRTTRSGEDSTIDNGYSNNKFSDNGLDTVKRTQERNEQLGGSDTTTAHNNDNIKFNNEDTSVRTPNLQEVQSNTGFRNTTNRSENTRTPNLETITASDSKNVRTPELTTYTEGSDSSTRTPDLTETNSGNDVVTNQYGKTTTDAQTVDGTNKSTDWDIVSETPQGGLNNITGGSNSITPSNVGQPPNGSSGTLYATAIDEKTSYNVTSAGTKQQTEGGSDTNTTAHGHIVKNTGSERNASNKSEQSISSGRETSTNTASDYTTSRGTEQTAEISNGRQEDGSSGYSKQTGTDTNYSKRIEETNKEGDTVSNVEYGRTNKANGSDTEENTRNRSGNNNTTTGNVRQNNYGSLEEYLRKTTGYNGISQSKLLNEFRETFLNIDLMIIEELRCLFFGILI